MKEMRERLHVALEGALKKLGVAVKLNGHKDQRLPNTLSLSFPHMVLSIPPTFVLVTIITKSILVGGQHATLRDSGQSCCIRRCRMSLRSGGCICSFDCHEGFYPYHYHSLYSAKDSNAFGLFIVIGTP